MNTHIREPINGLTHLFGAVLSLTALIVMLIKAVSIVPGPVEIAENVQQAFASNPISHRSIQFKAAMENVKERLLLMYLSQA